MPRGLPPPLALAYHGVDDVPLRRDPDHLFVRPQDLRRQIDKLRAWGYELVTFGDLAADVRPGRVALTFDDGLVDNLTMLAPILRELGAPATVFVVSGWLGQPHPSATWTRIVSADELRELRDAGLEVGGHSATHADLSALSYEDALEELSRGKKELEDVLGEPVEVAAYPYGRTSSDAIRAARDAGFRAACSTSARGSWDEPHFLPRQDMDNRGSLLGLRLKRDDRYESLMKLAPARAARRVGRHVAAALK
ncbi:MAG TPA: polysaccharide deacetylase family protein [Gaiellaceae bacterium]|jgi:peptidoglycan/xylan/chitin deacetylase (PgdA/CDA1 family)